MRFKQCWGLLMPKVLNHLQNFELMALGRPLHTKCERESCGWVCVSETSRIRHKVDTQSLLVGHMYAIPIYHPQTFTDRLTDCPIGSVTLLSLCTIF
jgi:hypothetical protein